MLELIRDISKSDDVILVTRDVPQLSDIEAKRFPIGERRKSIPVHINGMIDVCKTLLRIKKEIQYDYAISFDPDITLCYKWCGYRNIISLFRENLIGYIQVAGPSRLELLYYLWKERTAVRASQKIIVQCKADRDNLIRRNVKYDPNVGSKIYVQINNANASWMKTDSVEHKSFSDGIVRILFMGNFLGLRKGHTIILPAISMLLDEGYSIEFLAAGGGGELEEYKKQYAQYPAIKFLGHINNMPDYLSIADFLVVPSLIDSCPNAVLEGLNAGVAVYGANTGGIPELLGDPEYLFEPDSDSIYRFLKKVLDEEKYKDDAQKQHQRKIDLTFDWGQSIRKIIVCDN